MVNSYKCLYEGACAEIIEKKSRFIATIRPINTEQEATDFIDEMKKKYWDANHNCSAYVIGSKNEIERCSDDGEPSKTAGRPMLDVLINEGIHNVAAVVTRYFGGTLLGTGGLVRAYQGAVKEGLLNCTIIEKVLAKKLEVITDYNGIGKLQYIASTMNIITLDTIYTDIVTAILLVTEETEHAFCKKFLEATNGKAIFNELDRIYYTNVNGSILEFTIPNEISKEN